MRTQPGLTATGVPAQRRYGPTPAALELMELADLRTMRKGLMDEEARVSYWRRILQARIDLLEKDSDQKRVRISELAELLSWSGGTHRRIAALGLAIDGDLLPLPDLADLWNRPTPATHEDRLELLTRLGDAEHRLSKYRSGLHATIDASTKELIRRYRANPGLALIAVAESLPHVAVA